MAEPIRCPSCGASNAAGSAWCGQCLARFDAPPVAAPPAPIPARTPVATPEPEPTPAPAAAAPAPRLESVPSRGVYRDGDQLVWNCPSCDTVNTIEVSVCAVCATPMAAVFGARTGSPELRRKGSAAVGLSMAMPGAGHIYAGKIPDGVARIILFVWTFGIAVLLLTRNPSRGKAVMRGLGALYLIAALAVWGISLIEGQRLSRGDATPLVPGRVLLWTSASLTLILFLGLAAATQIK